MNYHLNLFKPYNQGEKQDPIENNLTRSLAIVLQNNSLLFYKFLELIVDKLPRSYNVSVRDIFSEFRNADDLNIQIQVNMQEYEGETFDKGVFAVCLTMQSFDMDNFNEMSMDATQKVRHITDIVIELNSALFIIEIKSNGNDCRQQLYDQVQNLVNGGNEVRAASITWTEVLQVLYTLRSIQRVAYEKNVFIEDYISLLESHFPSIIPAMPFSSFNYNTERDTVEREKMYRRLHKCVVGLKEHFTHQLGDYYDRIPVLVNWGWAREISFWFAEGKHEGAYLYGYIWPANTKGQGNLIYHRSMDWLNKKYLQAGEHQLSLEIDYEVKFCHFNRYVSSVKFKADQLKPGMVLHSKANFYETGKYYRDNPEGHSWEDLADWLDEYFVPTFDWRKQCGWEENFVHTKRLYLTVSFGFQVRCLIPYSLLQQIDKRDEDYGKVSALMSEVVLAYEHLID